MKQKRNGLLAWILALTMGLGLPQGTMAAEFTGGDLLTFESDEFTDEAEETAVSKENLTEPENCVEQEASEDTSEEPDCAAEVFVETEELAIEDETVNAPAFTEEISENPEEAQTEEAAEEEYAETVSPEEEAQSLTLDADSEEEAGAAAYTLSGLPEECNVFDVYESLLGAKVTVDYAEGTTEDVTSWNSTSVYDSQSQSYIRVYYKETGEGIELTLRLYDADGNMENAPCFGELIALGNYTVKLYADGVEVSCQKMRVSDVGCTPLTLGMETPYSVGEDKSILYTFAAEAGKKYVVKFTNATEEGYVYPVIWRKAEDGTYVYEWSSTSSIK